MEWVIQNTVEAVGLAGLILLFGRFLRRRPAMCHALWLLVLVKLVMPPGVMQPWRVPLSLWPVAEESPAPPSVLPAPGAGVEVTSEATHEIAQLPWCDLEAPPAHGLILQDPVMDAGSLEAGPAVGVHLVQLRVFEILLILWVAGALVTAGVQIRRIFRIRRLLHGARAAPIQLRTVVEDMARCVKVKPPRTRITRGILSPLLWCLGRPRLIWPHALVHGLDSTARRSAVAHELVHLRRRDHWVGWLVLTAGCLWWWNPLFWYVKKQLHQWAERACDAWVVWMEPRNRRGYARTLIEVSRFVSETARPMPALGMSAAAYQELERRLTMILNPGIRRGVPAWGLLLLGILTLSVLPGFSFSQDQEEVTVVKPAGMVLVVTPEVTSKCVEVALEGITVAAGCPGKGKWTAAQAVGAPDTMGAGLKATAWTPRKPDGGVEWLYLTYRHAVHPVAVRIYETCNPGAVFKVTLLQSGNEVTAWQGTDPTAGNLKRGISLIHLDPPRGKTRLVKIYLDTRRVKGHNAIDAVELLGREGPQFAVSARASSSLADRDTVVACGGGVVQGSFGKKTGSRRILKSKAPTTHSFGTQRGRVTQLQPGRVNIVLCPTCKARTTYNKAFKSAITSRYANRAKAVKSAQKAFKAATAEPSGGKGKACKSATTFYKAAIATKGGKGKASKIVKKAYKTLKKIPPATYKLQIPGVWKSTPSSAGKRIEALERELRELKRLIRQLQKKLDRTL